MTAWRRKCGLLLALIVALGFGILLFCFDTTFYHYRPGTVLVLVTQSQPRLPDSRNQRPAIVTASNALASSSRTKLILFTTRPATNSTRFPGVDKASKLCPRCEFTHDRRLWNQSDAVLFNGFFLEEQPPYKSPGQVWVYYFRDAPPRLGKPSLQRLKNYRGLFNWMMTYRSESEVYMPYARLESADPKKFSRKNVIARFKKKNGAAPAAWIVSHCKTDSKRELLVEKLSKLVAIDVYGACGPLKCKTTRHTSVGSDCRSALAEKYKFYLAFENCLCQEYVTEKFYDILSMEMVPIVYSGGNYTALGIPAGSYLDVADFKSVEELAERILWLADHPNEYVDYLEARAGIKTAREGWPANWCRICDKLTSDEDAQVAYVHEDVEEWLNRPSPSRDNGPVCVPPPEIVTGS